MAQLLARRRMTRSFDGTPVDSDWLDDLCATALWSPTAGNCAGVRMYTVGAERVGAYFERATDAEWRERAARFEGLRRAGAVVVITSRPQDYLDRYGESDKRASGLASREAWRVPYWHTDAAMAAMSLLLLLEERGWSATLWGNFRHDDDVLAWIGARDEALFGSILIGRADGGGVRARSLDRDVPSRAARVRRVD